jgi:membrane protein implicated in regulation of membrane protease activity
MVIAWLVLGVVLLAFELHHLAFYALFGALGAFAAAAVAVVWPDLYAAQVAAFVAVGDDRHLGHVRLAGERWLAASGSGLPIPADTIVLVTAVRGTTLTVWPVDGNHPPIELPGSEGEQP